jgi:phospholipid-binding lipoprotein MlaA
MRNLILAVLFLSPAMVSASDDADSDALEPLNRAIFSLNDSLDQMIAEPMARAYSNITPDPVEQGIANVFSNLEELTNAANNGLQGKMGGFVYSTGRFLINSTIGMAGLFDAADKLFEMPKDEPEDFGQTLAVWGVGEGSYVMIPFLGPSSIRDAPSRFIDTFTNPLRYHSNVSLRNSMTGASLLSARAGLLGVDDLVSGDEYVFVRDIYRQRRSYLIKDGAIEDDFGDDDDY